MRGGFGMISEAMHTIQSTYSDIGRSFRLFSERDQRSDFVNSFMELCGHIDKVTTDIEEATDAGRRDNLNMRLNILNMEMQRMRDEQGH